MSNIITLDISTISISRTQFHIKIIHTISISYSTIHYQSLWYASLFLFWEKNYGIIWSQETSEPLRSAHQAIVWVRTRTSYAKNNRYLAWTMVLARGIVWDWCRTICSKAHITRRDHNAKRLCESIRSALYRPLGNQRLVEHSANKSPTWIRLGDGLRYISVWATPPNGLVFKMVPQAL